MRIGATPGCSGCAGLGSHTEPCRVRSGKTLADERESESSRPVGAGIGSTAKMTVELQQPTAVMQQEPSSSPSSGPTAPIQEPTQNIQNEQMDSPMEMEAQERRGQRRVRLNETLSSEMSKRPVVKAKPVHSPTIAPMMERLGSIVVLPLLGESISRVPCPFLDKLLGYDQVIQAATMRHGLIYISSIGTTNGTIKRTTTEAKPVHSPTIAPMMERLGSIVVLPLLESQ